MNKPSTKVNEPLPLSTKHALWILGWAMEKCANEINRCERELVQHRALRDTSPTCLVTAEGLGSALEYDRTERMQRLETSLREYGECMRFLMGAKMRTSEKSAEEFAQSMREHLRGGK
jgi:hypothetical protein